ncbi:MAG: DUF2480 family protein [Bacteroidetes bacterium]|nr:MAG: DUF2480 family protein [Bacteroidota bacterium]
METKEFRNKVEANGIVTVDLLDYRPTEMAVVFDIKEGLYMGLIVKEKEFRSFLSEHDWEQYQGKPVAILCSVDSIIPTWAYMAVAEKLSDVASHIEFTSPELMDIRLWTELIMQADFESLRGQKVVVRQSSKLAPQLYVAITQVLKPLVKTLMYGEAGLPKVIYKA